MASDTVRFEITKKTSDPWEMLGVPWGASLPLKALAKRLKVALGKAGNDEALALVKEALAQRSPGERNLVALDTSAKASTRIHARLARGLGVRHETKAQQTTPKCIKALAAALEQRDPGDLAPILEGSWLGEWDGRGRSLQLETWELHALLAVVDPRVAPPRTVRLSAAVESLQAGVPLPKAQASRAVEDFALRMLAFHDGSGPLGSVGDLSGKVPDGLPFPFVVTMTDGSTASATLHVLTLPEVVQAFAPGLQARGIAWG